MTDLRLLKKQIYDVIGVGIGPFNLGMAALMSNIDNINSLFFESKNQFGWHESMLLDNSKLQVNFLKDLVTPVEPTNKYSFLSYLVSEKRLYQFINRKINMISRAEFNQYLQWVSKDLDNLNFGESIDEMSYDNKNFVISSQQGIYYAKNIVIGTGTSSYIPKNFDGLLSRHVFHSIDYLKHKKTLNFKDKNIIIIGGGQSGAEIFDDIISSDNAPSKITWVSKRANFQPLEDACFSNEFYTPTYVDYFRQLPLEIRKGLLDEHRLTSDGISQSLADSIYNKLYELKFIKKTKTHFNLMIKHCLDNVDTINSLYALDLKNIDNHKITREIADIVILATGFKHSLPECVSALFPETLDINELIVNKDYSIQWKHSDNNKIYIQNGAKQFFGVADANLSLAAWRNAVIINSIMQKNIYHLDTDSPLLTYPIENESVNDIYALASTF